MDTLTFNYVATPSEIEVLARDYFMALNVTGEGRVTYLRALVDTTKAQLKLEKGEPLPTLEKVHVGFYEAVLKAAEAATPPRIPGRAKEINKKSNFARSAASMLRSWMRHKGNDITKLVTKRVTKSSLVVPHKARPPSPARLKARVEAASKALVSHLLALGDKSPSVAGEELELLMTQLTDQLGAITGGATTTRAVKRFQSARTQILSKAEVARALSS